LSRLLKTLTGQSTNKLFESLLTILISGFSFRNSTISFRPATM